MKKTVDIPKAYQSKLEQTRTQIGDEKENKKVIQDIGAKYVITEKEKNLQIFKEVIKPKLKPV